MTEVSVVYIPEVQLYEKIGIKLDCFQVTSCDLSSAGEIADLSLVSRQDDCSVVSHFPLGRSITCHSKKKLLVLDLNGLLADFVPSVPEGYTPHEKISGKAGHYHQYFVSHVFSLHVNQHLDLI